MEPNDSVLMNFNISPHLKTIFYDICRYKNISMTSQLNMLIENFTKKELFEIKNTEWMEDQKKHPLDFYIESESIPRYEDWN
jgi:hypothetical protein